MKKSKVKKNPKKDIAASAKCIRLIPYVILLQTRVIHAIFVCIWLGLCFRRYLSIAYRGKFALLLFYFVYLFFCILPFTVDAEGGNCV